MDTRFIADSNVGKLAKWLRMLGYDTLFITSIDDGRLVEVALSEGRIILTKDSQIMKRGIITTGKVKAIFIDSDNSKEQLRQVVQTLRLNCQFGLFTRCLECNRSLVPRSREEVQFLVPPFVFKTQTHYMQCPECQRVYWRGTHWQRMKGELGKVAEG